MNYLHQSKITIKNIGYYNRTKESLFFKCLLPWYFQPLPSILVLYTIKTLKQLTFIEPGMVYKVLYTQIVSQAYGQL
jgi:hypothetical protein